MPDIEDINGVSIANVNAFSGVTLSGVEGIDGLSLPTPAPAAAYSVRLLGSAVGISSYTGPAMRVRRDTAGGTGDDDEADIAFDSGVISLDSAISNASAGVNATTLGEFLNVGTVPPYNGGLAFSDPDSLVNTASCYVVSWKDQSGNGNDADQPTAGGSSLQPQIHSGTANTDLITENGKPALDFDGSNDYLATAQLTTVSQPTTKFAVSSFDDVSTLGKGYITDGHTLRQVIGETPDITSKWRLYAGSQQDYVNAPSINVQYLLTAIFDSPSELFVNGSSEGTRSVGTDGFDGVTVGAIAGVSKSVYHDGVIQELLIWTSDQDAAGNRTAIENDINGYFSIYT